MIKKAAVKVKTKPLPAVLYVLRVNEGTEEEYLETFESLDDFVSESVPRIARVYYLDDRVRISTMEES